ncbi:scavenger receptor cysteine-rich type 1 protein M160-like isoform 2-T2 [Pholidichthys leucotaenia]
MDHTLLCLFLVVFWSTDVRTDENHNPKEPANVRLVGGQSRCAGRVEVEVRGWRPVEQNDWTLKKAAFFCEQLDCGSAVSIGEAEVPSHRLSWRIKLDCVQSGSSLRECASETSYRPILSLTCSDSVRLLNGTSLCSGRLEVKSNQGWCSVCEADFDQQDAGVVCRELGCGPPSAHQGGLYGDVEAPKWSKDFQCGGGESALRNCRSSGSARSSCSPGKAVGLTCSEPEDDARLVGGDSRCAGTLEMKLAEWRPVFSSDWMLKEAAVFCEHLDCGSAVSIGQREGRFSERSWRIIPDCIHSGSSLRECTESSEYKSFLTLTCLDSVRLLNGTSLCSGRLEVKSNQGWSSVCEADFDQQDAEVVCRELGCGPPSALQGGLYGEVEALTWAKEFQCGGDESALLDCRSSGSARNSCSPGKAVGLTCSGPEDVRLVGGDSRCAGTVEVKIGEWRLASGTSWILNQAAVVCEHLDCGAVIPVAERKQSSYRPVWWIDPACAQSGLSLRECGVPSTSYIFPSVACLDSVRLLNGTSLCSGRLEVKANQGWSSVCEADFDHQDAEVVCRELGCGPPSVLQGGLYGDVEAPMWSKEFQCQGNESALLDCRTSDSARNSCSAGKAVGLTCSDPDYVRLVGRDSRCAGTVEMNLGEWRPVFISGSSLKTAAVFCEHLDCGSAVSAGEEQMRTWIWHSSHDCVESGSSLRECVSSSHYPVVLSVTCADPDVDVRLVEGDSRCAGTVEVKRRRWRPVNGRAWTLKEAAIICQHLDCGSAVSVGKRKAFPPLSMWEIKNDQLKSITSLRDAIKPIYSSTLLTLKCSDSVRLLNGTSLCSGRLEVKSNQNWSSVCEADFDQKDAEVVCRELGCGPPSVLQGGLYGDVEALMWTKEFQCGGHESALLDCRSSGSARSSCSPGKAVGLTCSGLPDQNRIRDGKLSQTDGSVVGKLPLQTVSLAFMYSLSTVSTASQTISGCRA